MFSGTSPSDQQAYSDIGSIKGDLLPFFQFLVASDVASSSTTQAEKMPEEEMSHNSDNSIILSTLDYTSYDIDGKKDNPIEEPSESLENFSVEYDGFIDRSMSGSTPRLIDPYFMVKLALRTGNDYFFDFITLLIQKQVHRNSTQAVSCSLEQLWRYKHLVCHTVRFVLQAVIYEIKNLNTRFPQIEYLYSAQNLIDLFAQLQERRVFDSLFEQYFSDSFIDGTDRAVETYQYEFLDAIKYYVPSSIREFEYSFYGRFIVYESGLLNLKLMNKAVKELFSLVSRAKNVCRYDSELYARMARPTIVFSGIDRDSQDKLLEQVLKQDKKGIFSRIPFICRERIDHIINDETEAAGVLMLSGRGRRIFKKLLDVAEGRRSSCETPGYYSSLSTVEYITQAKLREMRALVENDTDSLTSEERDILLNELVFYRKTFLSEDVTRIYRREISKLANRVPLDVTDEVGSSLALLAYQYNNKQIGTWISLMSKGVDDLENKAGISAKNYSYLGTRFEMLDIDMIRSIEAERTLSLIEQAVLRYCEEKWFIEYHEMIWLKVEAEDSSLQYVKQRLYQGCDYLLNTRFFFLTRRADTRKFIDYLEHHSHRGTIVDFYIKFIEDILNGSSCGPLWQSKFRSILKEAKELLRPHRGVPVGILATPDDKRLSTAQQMLAQSIANEKQSNKKIRALEEKSQVDQESSQKQFQAADHKAQAARDEAQAADYKAQAAGHKAQAAKDEAQAADHKAQAAKDEAQAAKDEAQAAKDEAQAAKDEAQAARDRAQAADHKAQAAKDEAQAAKDEAQAARDRAQAADDRTKATEERCILLEKELADLKAMMLSCMAAPPPQRAPSGASGFYARAEDERSDHSVPLLSPRSLG